MIFISLWVNDDCSLQSHDYPTMCIMHVNSFMRISIFMCGHGFFRMCFHFMIRKRLQRRVALFVCCVFIWYLLRLWSEGTATCENCQTKWFFMTIFFTKLMHKFFILIHLLYSSARFEHYCARLQEDNCIYTASGIVTLFGWLFSTHVTCVLNSHVLTQYLVSSLSLGDCSVRR